MYASHRLPVLCFLVLALVAAALCFSSCSANAANDEYRQFRFVGSGWGSHTVAREYDAKVDGLAVKFGNSCPGGDSGYTPDAACYHIQIIKNPTVRWSGKTYKNFGLVMFNSARPVNKAHIACREVGRSFGLRPHPGRGCLGIGDNTTTHPTAAEIATLNQLW